MTCRYFTGLQQATTKAPLLPMPGIGLSGQLPESLLSKPRSDNDLQWEFVVNKVILIRLIESCEHGTNEIKNNLSSSN